MHDAEMPALTGLVLAGGASRRMARDKAMIRVDGEPLVVRLVRRLDTICERVLVASGDGARLPGVGGEQVADVVDGAGPLAGIVAGLEAATTPLVAVVAVDMPFADPAVLVCLARQWAGEAAVVPVVDDRLQPLHGIYDVAAAPVFRRLLADGLRSVTVALTEVDARVVGPEAWAGPDRHGRFAVNVNRPQDLAGLVVDAPHARLPRRMTATEDLTS